MHLPRGHRTASISSPSLTGHVLAAVVAAALHHGGRARVAHAEALGGHAPEVGLAAGGACRASGCQVSGVGGGGVSSRQRGDSLGRHPQRQAGGAVPAAPQGVPYSTTLPTMMFSSALNLDSRGGYTAITPPLRPCPTGDGETGFGESRCS